MLIAARNGMMVGKKSILPPGAVPIEYLESEGRQALDTGVSASGSDSFRVRVEIYRTSLASSVMGAQDSSRTIVWFTGYITNGDIGASSGLYYALADDWETVDILASYSENKMTVTNNGVTSTLNGTRNWATGNFGLFASNTNNWMQRGFCKIRKCAIEKDGVLVRNFIPIKIEENGTWIGYMFDMISQTYLPFGNTYSGSGTHPFLLGPDKVSSAGGGYKRKCVRRSYIRSLRPSARFWRSSRQLRNLFTVHSSLFVARREVA